MSETLHAGPCPRCAGHGFYYNLVNNATPCKVCNGTGETGTRLYYTLEKGPRRVVCSNCDGLGYYAMAQDPSNRYECASCHGVGTVTYQGPEEQEDDQEDPGAPCGRCGGSGYVQDATYAGACPDCHGQGQTAEPVPPADLLWFNNHVAGCMAFRSAWLMQGPGCYINWPGVQTAIVLDLRVAGRLSILPEYLAALGARAVWLQTDVLEKARKAVALAAQEAGVRLPTHWARSFDPEEAAEVQDQA